MWELKSWVPREELVIHQLQLNPNAFDYVMEHHMASIDWNDICYNATDDTLISIPNEVISWYYLSTNPTTTAVHRLKKHPHKIFWYRLLGNPKAIDMIVSKFDKILNIGLINSLSQNTHPTAVELLAKHPYKIDWYYLSTNPSAIELLKQYPTKINWSGLSLNTNTEAIDMLLKNVDKINWSNFNRNGNVLVIDYLKQHQDKIVWNMLCSNPLAEELFLMYPEKLEWFSLSVNPCIFTFNYKRCRTVVRTTLFKEELVAIALHPDRIEKYLKMGYTFSDF